MAIITNMPDESIPAFQTLLSFDDETFDKLISLIDKSPIVFDPRTIAAPVGIYSKKDIEEIIKTIGGIILVRERKEVTSGEIADDTLRYLREKKPAGFILKSEDEGLLKQRLIKLLNNEELYLCTKPFRLLREYENILLDARIATDIRPIFGVDVEENLKAGMVVHNLHIHFRSGEDERQHRDIYFALDDNDLLDLKNIIERAQKKSKTIQSFLKSSGVTNLDLR